MMSVVPPMQGAPSSFLQQSTSTFPSPSSTLPGFGSSTRTVSGVCVYVCVCVVAESESAHMYAASMLVVRRESPWVLLTVS